MYALGSPWSSPMSSAAIPKEKKDYIKPGFEFGHKPFGAYYGLPVPTGKDGLPLFVDWSLIPGAVWEAPDQGNTGLCFMYASLGSVRSLNFIKTGKTDDPSTQQLIDCNTMSGGYCGGQPQEVLKYIIKGGGVLTSDSYPCTDEKGPCKRIKGHGIIIDDWKLVKPNCEASLKYAVAHQPVIVSIGATLGITCNEKPLKFDEYERGVLYGPSSYKLDHSALLIGYGKNYLGELLWLLLNSYGLAWGRSGFFQIARSTPQPGGTLGILREPLLPLKWSRNKMVLSKCESCSKCF